MKNDLLGTVRRALRVLDFLAERHEPQGPRAIAEALELNISTVYHLLNTLVHDGYVARDDRDGTFRLGTKIPRLHHAYVGTLPSSPRLDAILRRLTERTHENSYLALRLGANVVITEIVEAAQAVGVTGLYVGYHQDLHARALGKAVLAHLDEAAVREHFALEPPLARTAKTRTDVETILAELRAVRECGFSEDDEEFAEGVSCIGAPFFGRDGTVVGAISVSQPTFRFRRTRDAIIDAVRGAAAEANLALGFTHAPAAPARRQLIGGPAIG